MSSQEPMYPLLMEPLNCAQWVICYTILVKMHTVYGELNQKVARARY